MADGSLIGSRSFGLESAATGGDVAIGAAMMSHRTISVFRAARLAIAMAVLGSAVAPIARAGAGRMQRTMQVPVFRVDPMWPKPLPDHWIVGAVVGVAVDARDHVWVTHRPSTLQPNELRSIWRAAPPVLEFDQDGTLVSSWGGPGPGYEWPQLEHGIHVDYQDNVWLGAGGDKDAHILKFTRDGKFLMQIGHQGKGTGSNDTQNLGAAAHMVVDRATNELFVARRQAHPEVRVETVMSSDESSIAPDSGRRLLAAGTHIGSYRIEAPLGEGGMSLEKLTPRP